MNKACVLVIASLAVTGCVRINEGTLSNGQKVAFATNHQFDLTTTLTTMEDKPGSGVYRPVAVNSGTGTGNVALAGALGVATGAISATLLPESTSNTVVGNGAFVINATGGGGGDAAAIQSQ